MSTFLLQKKMMYLSQFYSPQNTINLCPLKVTLNIFSLHIENLLSKTNVIFSHCSINYSLTQTRIPPMALDFPVPSKALTPCCVSHIFILHGLVALIVPFLNQHGKDTSLVQRELAMSSATIKHDQNFSLEHIPHSIHIDVEFFLCTYPIALVIYISGKKMTSLLHRLVSHFPKITAPPLKPSKISLLQDSLSLKKSR